jgi:hypothetical protein
VETSRRLARMNADSEDWVISFADLGFFCHDVQHDRFFPRLRAFLEGAGVRDSTFQTGAFREDHSRLSARTCTLVFLRATPCASAVIALCYDAYLTGCSINYGS